MKTIKVKLITTEGMLGTSPFNEEIYRDFIGSKSPDAATVEEEVAALGADAVTEKGMTGFPRDEDGVRLTSLKSIPCRLVFNGESGWGSRCIGFGHFMKDKFVLTADFAKIDE